MFTQKPLYVKTPFPDGLHVSLPADEVHPMPALRQHATEDAADSACTVHEETIMFCTHYCKFNV
jgi:hypothetical protein